MIINERLMIVFFSFVLILTIFTGILNDESYRAKNVMFSSRDFHDYPAVTTDLTQIANNHSDIAALYDLGQSVEGRSIWGLKITDNPTIEESEPEVRICGAHHADESMSIELPLLLAWHLVENYSIDPHITDLIDNREIWIIPVVNPDGLMATPNPTRRNANNVDLNRDYGYIWESSGGSSAPFSQPETQVIRENALENNYVLSLSFHTSGDIVNYIWNHKGTPVADHDVVVELSNMYGANNGYWVVEGYDWYRITGDTNDFSYGCRGDIDWTIELQNYDIPNAWDKNKNEMIEIINASNMGLTGIVTDNDTGLPVAGTVWVEEAYWPCFTDPEVGDYHKPLLPGNYTVHFRANDYEEKTVDVDVLDSDDPTVLNVSLDKNNEWFAYQVTWYICADPFSYPNNYQNNPTEGISALGPPDNVFSSIGKGGEIVLDMQKDSAIVNGSGDDLIVYDGDLNPEGYYVEVSENWNGPWSSIGYGMGTSSFDLANGSLETAQFVKIIDDDDGDAYEMFPGFDLDAIQVLSNDTTDEIIANLSAYWNFFSIPFNQSINKTDIIVKHKGSVYNWANAVNTGIVSNFIFGWDRDIQSYNFADVLHPGYGFWLYTFDNCELWVENTTVSYDDYITNLKKYWNIIGLPDENPVNKTDVFINYSLWDDAVSAGMIGDIIFQWDEDVQSYSFSDRFLPGKAYWLYAYNPCTMTQ